jgi:16S rRNA (cytidine1402-2'-O)-methyltransferase
VAGTLFLVGTPIGNVGDVSDRARSTLAAVDVVACEDTRRTGRLLSRLGVEAKLVSFYEENERARVPELVARLRAGADVALVSDAGMPALSDPGYRLVAACVEEGVPIDVVPGPSAAVAALVISGLPTDRFVFEGFLPRTGRARADRLAALARERRTAVLFEAPGRTAATLRDLGDVCGDRRVAVARELTKLHQEVVRGRLPDVAEDLAGRTLRGEVAIVLEGAPTVVQAGGLRQAVTEAERLVAGGARKREAAKEAGRQHGVPSSRVYAALVQPSSKK